MICPRCHRWSPDQSPHFARFCPFSDCGWMDDLDDDEEEEEDDVL